MTAAYDGQVRVFDYSQQLLRTIPTHDASATSITVIGQPSASAEHNFYLIASASHDTTARITKTPIGDSDSDQQSAVTLASLHLHTAPIASIESSSLGSHLLTASWESAETAEPRSHERGTERDSIAAIVDDASSERRLERHPRSSSLLPESGS